MSAPRRALLLCLALLAAPAPALAAGQEATCTDIYQIYQTCYDGGKNAGAEGCSYLIQALGPRLMGEEGLSGMSAAMSVAICKDACTAGAAKKPAISMDAFRSAYCSGVK
jgi:hypothetical protein